MKGVVGARIASIETYLPDTVLGNDHLASLYPGWSADKIFEKTGIAERRIAAEGETALDLAVSACKRLFERVDSGLVDFVILCTQAPDYILPTSACILQHRLGLSTSVGALDINLGCSGFVYGLSLAAGLIASGASRGVLLVTADTYSKYIHPRDKSVRTLFGDGAAATLVVPDDQGSAIGPFVFGTDGSGAGSLIVEAGAFRLPATAETGKEETDRSGNVRSRNHLYMDGGAVLNFTLQVVPPTFAELLDRAELTPRDVDHVVMHQANRFMLDKLQRKLGLSDNQVPRNFENAGNTVSSTIPFVLAGLDAEGRLRPGTKTMLIGFGVGLSWAGALLQS